jgi:hypothetical protein
VYAHPVKVAAGAMIGKAVYNVLSTKRKPRLTEPMVESMGDIDLLDFLRNSGRPLAKKLVEMVVGTNGRDVWKQSFAAPVLRESEPDRSHYQDRLTLLTGKGWFTLAGRAKIENEIAGKAGVHADDLIFYCAARAPGLQRIRQYVGVDPITTRIHRDEEQYRRIYSAHMNLWTCYVFVAPDMDLNRMGRVAKAASDLLELENDVDLRPKQLALFL